MTLDKPAGTCADCGQPLRWVTARRPWRLSHMLVNKHQPRQAVAVHTEPAMTVGAR